MNMSLFILLALTATALVVALAKDPQLVARGLHSSSRLLGSVWIELALGFLLAGLLDVLIPPPALSRWLGGNRLARASSWAGRLGS